MSSSTRRWRSALAFWGVAPADADWRIVACYIIARCAPPVDVALPDCCAQPVLPSTVAGEISTLRRAATLRVNGMEEFAQALGHPEVTLLLQQIGSRVRRSRTPKKALLLAAVARFWQECAHKDTCDSLRDGFALVLAFFFAMRARELLTLRSEDIDYITTAGARPVLRVSFRQTKTRRSIFLSHEPLHVHCGHPLLMAAFAKFDDTVEFIPRTVVFRKQRTTPEPLDRRWLANVVQRAAPDATPHSARVGCATELWAAGATMEEVMAVGRWRSSAAALYILGPLQDQLRATDRLDGGELVYTTAGLQARGAFHGHREDLPRASFSAWKAVAQNIPAEDETGDD
jgi:integrase